LSTDWYYNLNNHNYLYSNQGYNGPENLFFNEKWNSNFCSQRSYNEWMHLKCDVGKGKGEEWDVKR